VEFEFRPAAGVLTQTPMGVGVILCAGSWPYPGLPAGIPWEEAHGGPQWEVLVVGKAMRFYEDQLAEPSR
jgi:hypothetical protein